MAFKEAEIVVQKDDGTNVKITVKTFLHKERTQLNRLVTPPRVNTKSAETQGYEIELGNLEKYSLEYVKLCVKSPPECISYGFLEELPDLEFSRLFLACQRLNGDVPALAAEAEKKSVGPSSGESVTQIAPKSSSSTS